MGLLSNATGFMRGTLTQRDGFVITYVPAGGSPVPFPTIARTGRSKTTLQAEEWGAETVRMDDFLIRRTSLEQLGRDPKRGDRIQRQLGTTTLTFEVLPFGDEPEWRWSDADQTEYRIHTKHVKTETSA